MDFIIELILEIFGFATDEAMESKKVPLKAKVIVISVLCGLLTAASLVCGIYFGAAEKNAGLCILFIFIAFLFVGMGVYGIKKQIKRHKR